MPTIFKVVQPGVNDSQKQRVRLVKAENGKALRAHLLSEFVINEASAEDAHDLGKQGVEIEIAEAE